MLSLRCAAFSASLIFAMTLTAQEGKQPDKLAKATPTSGSAKAPIAKAVPGPASLAARPLSVTITLVNQSAIRGTLTDTTDLQMKTSFGEVTVPLSEVAGVRFASAKDTVTSVVMLNGDSITGATDVKRLVVQTEWGAAQVNGSSVASIMLVPALQWSSITGLNGKRWYLTQERTQPAPTPTPTRSSTTSNRSTSSRYPQSSAPVRSYSPR